MSRYRSFSQKQTIGDLLSITQQHHRDEESTHEESLSIGVLEKQYSNKIKRVRGIQQSAERINIIYSSREQA